jgi:4,5-dihydroxyphthalate decarboxylase
MAAGQEFDAAEFSSSEYVSRFVANQCPFVAIPVFASRVFRHSFIFINKKHIKSPKDLEGKRIGVPVYTMTAAIFIRGLLSDEHGIDFRNANGSRATSTAPNRMAIRPSCRPRRSSRSPPTSPASRSARCSRTARMQAIIGTGVPRAFGRNPDIVGCTRLPCGRDGIFQAHQDFTIMHTVVIRRDIHERIPFLATALYHALDQSKNLALKEDELSRARCVTCCRG